MCRLAPSALIATMPHGTTPHQPPTPVNNDFRARIIFEYFMNTLPVYEIVNQNQTAIDLITLLVSATPEEVTDDELREIKDLIWDSVDSRYVWPSAVDAAISDAAAAGETEGDDGWAPSPYVNVTQSSFDFVINATLHSTGFKLRPPQPELWPSVDEVSNA